MANDRDTLAELLIEAAIEGMGPRETAVHLGVNGVRPPAQVIDTRDGIAEAPTGTVVRFSHGDVGSVDHGPHGEWTGLGTRIHLLLPGGGHLRVCDLPPRGLGAEVIWSPTEKAGQ